jgi:predicted RNA methylase
MIGIVGLTSVVIGAIIAYASDRCPSHIEALETAAGLLVFGGFFAAGYALSTLIIV